MDQPINGRAMPSADCLKRLVTLPFQLDKAYLGYVDSLSNTVNGYEYFAGGDVGGVFHASVVGHPCQRYIAFNVAGFPPLWPAAIEDRFTEGRLHDAILKTVFARSNLPTLPSHPVTQTYDVMVDAETVAVALTGCPDVTVDGTRLSATQYNQEYWPLGANIPIELKAVAAHRFKIIKQQQAPLEKSLWWQRWVVQVQCYAALLNAPLGVLVVKNKETGELWQQAIPAMTSASWQGLLTKLATITQILKHTNVMRVAGYPMHSPSCQQCPYVHACHTD